MKVEQIAPTETTTPLQDYDVLKGRLVVIEEGYGGWHKGMVLWVGNKEVWCFDTETYVSTNAYCGYETTLVRPVTGPVTLTPDT